MPKGSYLPGYPLCILHNKNFIHTHSYNYFEIWPSDDNVYEKDADVGSACMEIIKKSISYK